MLGIAVGGPASPPDGNVAFGVAGCAAAGWFGVWAVDGSATAWRVTTGALAGGAAIAGAAVVTAAASLDGLGEGDAAAGVSAPVAAEVPPGRVMPGPRFGSAAPADLGTTSRFKSIFTGYCGSVVSSEISFGVTR